MGNPVSAAMAAATLLALSPVVAAMPPYSRVPEGVEPSPAAASESTTALIEAYRANRPGTLLPASAVRNAPDPGRSSRLPPALPPREPAGTARLSIPAGTRE